MMKTEHLSIEVLRPEHAELLFGELRDERIYLYIPERPPVSVEVLKARYKQLVAGPSPGSKERWLNWIMFAASDGAPVGTLQATVLFEERRSYVAYVVFPRYWRQGIAIEGLAWLLEHLRSNHAVDLALAEINVRNDASLAVMRRLGFSYSETIRSGECEDHVFVKRLDNETG